MWWIAEIIVGWTAVGVRCDLARPRHQQCGSAGTAPLLELSDSGRALDGSFRTVPVARGSWEIVPLRSSRSYVRLDWSAGPSATARRLPRVVAGTSPATRWHPFDDVGER